MSLVNTHVTLSCGWTQTKCCTPTCVNQWPNDTGQCGTPYITILLVWLKKIREQQKMIHDETKIRRVRSKSWTIDSWSRSRSRTRDSRPRRQRSQSRSRQTSLNSQVWMIIAEQLHLGCPRERFLAITSGTVPIFLQADRITYFPQHIKKLELAGVGTAIKFLHGGVLLKF